MTDPTPALAQRIARHIAAGRSFFTIQKIHGMPTSFDMRRWMLTRPDFRRLIEQAQSRRQPKAPRGDDPETWGIDDDQMEFSSRHGGVVPVEVKVLGSKTKQQGLRRAPDARMFDSFTAPQERAYYRIASAQKLYVMGIGYKTANLIRVDRSYTGDWEEVRATELKKDYDGWKADCKRRRLKADQAMDMMGLGMNLTESGQCRNQPRLKIRENLIACLNVFCERKGWL